MLNKKVNNIVILLLLLVLTTFNFNCDDDDDVKPAFVRDLTYLKGKKRLLVVSKVTIIVDELLDKEVKKSIKDMIAKVDFNEKHRRAVIKEILRKDKKNRFLLVIDPKSLDRIDSYIVKRPLGSINYAKIKNVNTDLILELDNSIYISGHRDDLVARRLEHVRLLKIDRKKKNRVTRRLYQTSKETMYDSIFEKNKIKANLRNFKLSMTRILFSDKCHTVHYLLKLPSNYEPEEYDFKERRYDGYDDQNQPAMGGGSPMM